MGTKCNDPLITYLKSIGYLAVRHPRAGLRPMEFLSRQGSELSAMGGAEDVFVIPPAVVLPEIVSDTPAAYLKGKSSGKLGASAGVSLLDSIVGALGGGTMGLKASFSKAADVVFHFPEVLVDSVAPAAVAKFLSTAGVRPSSAATAGFLEDDDVYVVTDTAKSKLFVIEALDEHGAAAEVDIPKIKGVVGGELGVESRSSRGSRIAFEGKIPLVFAFQAIQLVYTDGRFESWKNVAAGTMARRGLKRRTGVPKAHAGHLSVERALVDIRVR
jgi:hypothetical protein